MATASLPRSRRPQLGAGQPGFQRPHGPPGGASRALGPPADGRWFLLRCCLGRASLCASQTRPHASQSTFALLGDELVPAPRAGTVPWMENRSAGRAKGAGGNV